MMYKVQNIFISVIVMILISSCSNKKKDYVTKFIYINFRGVSIDSTFKPHLNIRQYFEYKQNTSIKIATGGYYDFENTRKYNLGDFYNLTPIDTFNEFLNKTFCEIPYGSTCKQKIDILNMRDTAYCFKETMMQSMFFIVETFENKKIELNIYPDSLTSELKSLYTYVKNVFDSNKLIKVNPFKVDSSVAIIEKQFFLYYPPPPPPPPEVLEQKVKFTAPKIKKKDTIVLNKKMDSIINLPSLPQ